MLTQGMNTDGGELTQELNADQEEQLGVVTAPRRTAVGAVGASAGGGGGGYYMPVGTAPPRTDAFVELAQRWLTAAAAREDAMEQELAAERRRRRSLLQRLSLWAEGLRHPRAPAPPEPDRPATPDVEHPAPPAVHAQELARAYQQGYWQAQQQLWAPQPEARSYDTSGLLLLLVCPIGFGLGYYGTALLDRLLDRVRAAGRPAHDRFRTRALPRAPGEAHPVSRASRRNARTRRRRTASRRA